MLMIVTDVENVDAIRTLPYDNVPVIAYGVGFVNRAMNAVRVETVDNLFQEINHTLQRFVMEKGMDTPSGDGIFCAPGVYVTWDAVFVYGARFELTELGLLILRCLIFSGMHYRNADQLAAYCCTSENKNSANIRVHVSLINELASFRLPKPLIECKYGTGYRFGYLSE